MIRQPAEPAGQDFDVATLGESGRLVYRSLKRVERWVEVHHFEGYEPFDGLASPLRRLTHGSLLLDRLLQQAVRQSPLNLRPLLGIKPLPSTKGRGAMAAGYLALQRLGGDSQYGRKAVECLEWLMVQRSPRFQEYSWANHFDFASRAGRYSRDESIIVWTALIGQAFLDAFELLGERRFLEVAESVCRWILALPRERTRDGTCISYHALGQLSIHNANMLGAAMLARTWRHTRRPEYLDAAASAMAYSCARQRPDGSWLYGEDVRFHWIDSFHTAYNLDSLKRFIESSGDITFRPHLNRGFQFFKSCFFETDGCPKYYHDRARPIDIHCASNGIQTLASFADEDEDAVPTALRVARWTIDNMQDASGHFYYRKYPLLVAKTPMLHWGQATMFQALAVLLTKLWARNQGQ